MREYRITIITRCDGEFEGSGMPCREKDICEAPDASYGGDELDAALRLQGWKIEGGVCPTCNTQKGTTRHLCPKCARKEGVE